jgi:hypothetical protein
MCFILGVAARLLAVSVLTGMGQPYTIQWMEIVLIDLRAQTWEGATL